MVIVHLIALPLASTGLSVAAELCGSGPLFVKVQYFAVGHVGSQVTVTNISSIINYAGGVTYWSISPGGVTNSFTNDNVR